jgi:hypothetical protein
MRRNELVQTAIDRAAATQTTVWLERHTVDYVHQHFSDTTYIPGCPAHDKPIICDKESVGFFHHFPVA